mmetsp:Transcript_68859/g.186068  ORF Transcript_68859/g.186068 Transcript_68859/m.186068 type:complete len:303 (-) Transcript_68859:59-967(-)
MLHVLRQRRRPSCAGRRAGVWQQLLGGLLRRLLFRARVRGSRCGVVVGHAEHLPAGGAAGGASAGQRRAADRLVRDASAVRGRRPPEDALGGTVPAGEVGQWPLGDLHVRRRRAQLGRQPHPGGVRQRCLRGRSPADQDSEAGRVHGLPGHGRGGQLVLQVRVPAERRRRAPDQLPVLLRLGPLSSRSAAPGSGTQPRAALAGGRCGVQGAGRCCCCCRLGRRSSLCSPPVLHRSRRCHGSVHGRVPLQRVGGAGARLADRCSGGFTDAARDSSSACSSGGPWGSPWSPAPCLQGRRRFWST